MAATEQNYLLEVVPAGPIERPARDGLMPFIERFEPLDFEAAHKAKAWLETNVSASKLPWDTYLVYSEDGAKLLGFFVLAEEEVQVEPGDIPIMQVRHTIQNPRAETQRAAKLIWIARSHDSDAGLGGELFEHALVVAYEAGCCALMVEPYDPETAEKLWVGHFELREPRTGTDSWTCLWHPLVEADQTFC